MECNDAESAAFCQAVCRLVDGSLQHIQFSIDFNTNCLERTLCRMGAVFSGTLWHSLFDDIHQFSGGFDGLVSTLCHNKLRNAFCPTFFTISKNDAIQIGFAVCIDHNTLFVVDYQGEELLVPAQEEFIIDIDQKHKVITVDLPEGLIALDETEEV